MINKISIIIPFKENFEYLENTLNHLMLGEILPDEIIIIDTSNNEFFENFNSICNRFKLLKVITAAGSYPGEARNIGIDNSSFNLLGFLDVRTIPHSNWLSSSLKLIEMNFNISGVYGNTEYHTSREKSLLIKYSTYGFNPLVTVPGMLIKRSAITKVGNFIPTTRAGEDADWMIRLKLQKIPMTKPLYSVIYQGLDDVGFIYLFFKWIRNYRYSSNLPYLNAHKSIYYHGFVLLVLIAAFNWNGLIAEWDVDSGFYIPHITKFIILFLFIFYSVIRGVVLPVKKGVGFLSLIPFRWFFITLISFGLDIAKLCGFFYGSIKRKT